VSANNAILECIKYNIPIILPNYQALRFYLGKNYPLFYTNESDIHNILNDKSKLLEAHMYIKNMNKTIFSFTYNILNTLKIIENYLPNRL
jgi:hypothetical protein